jgi:hypothetical protein
LNIEIIDSLDLHPSGIIKTTQIPRIMGFYGSGGDGGHRRLRGLGAKEVKGAWELKGAPEVCSGK